MIVRELITKIGFRVDTAKLRAVERRMTRIKKISRETSQNMREMANGIRNIGLGMSAFVTAPIVALGIAALKTSSSLEKAKIALEVFLGSEEKALAMQKDLIDFAAKTPFQILGIQETAGQLLAAGIESEKLIETMNALGNAAKGDQAIFQRLVANFGQVKTQAKLTGRDMLQFQMAMVPMTKLLAKQMGVAEKSIAGMVSAGQIKFADVEKAFFNASKEGGFFFNLMLKQSKTLAGRWSNLEDTMSKLFNEIGVALTETLHLKEGLQKLIEVIDRWTRAFKEASPWVKKTIIFVTILIAAIGPLLLLLGLVTGAVIALGVAMLFLDTTMLPIILIVTAVIAVLALLSFMIFLVLDDYWTWKQGGDSVIGAMIARWKQFKTFIKDTLKDIRDYFINFWADIKLGMGQMWKDMMADMPAPIKALGRFAVKHTSNVGPMGFAPLGASSFSGPGVVPGASNNQSVNVKAEITVPPGTTEQQQKVLEDGAVKVYTEMTNKMLADALNSSPRNEN